jgi:hypothetical protein
VKEYSKEEILRIPPTFFRFDSKYSKRFQIANEKPFSKKFNKVKYTIRKARSTKISHNYNSKFTTMSEVADLYKTEEYADDIENNYALVAEEHYYSVSFTFDGTHLKKLSKLQMQ